MKKHTEQSCIDSLKKKNDIRIFPNKKLIVILENKIFSQKTLELINNPKKQNDLGNKSQGKISFLCNYLNYYLFHFDDFDSKDFTRFIKQLSIN